MNYYPHHIGDYARDTSHLSMTEDGAYRRLMDICYSTEKPLSLDRAKVYKRVRAQSKIDRDAVDTVLEEFFEQRADGWHQKRIDEEIQHAVEEGEEGKAKRENEKERQRRYRTRRKELFEALREYGAVPKWDTPVEQLETLLSQEQTRNSHAPVTRDSPVTEARQPRLTNNQEPIANSQGKPLSPASAGEAPDGAVPDCPHDRIIELYHEILPTCPRVIEWHETRRATMRARWREKAQPNGSSQGYRTADEGLAYWRRFFEWCADSEFLTGKSEPSRGKKPFVADLEWLIKPTNFAKVIEGKYA